MVPLKTKLDEALAKALGDEKVLVVRHTGDAVPMKGAPRLLVPRGGAQASPPIARRRR